MPIKFLNSGLLEGSLQLTSYGSGSISGTGTYNLGVDASGNVIETSLIEGSGTTNYVVKWTPDGSTLGNSQIFDDGTNVGIGTANPADLFHIDAGTTTAFFRLQGGGGFGRYTLMYNNDNDFLLRADSSTTGTSTGTVNFAVGPTDGIQIGGSGQVTFWQYGSGTFTGTAAKNLSITSTGNIIETDAVPSNVVETVTTTDGTYINLTPNSPTDGAVTVTADLSAVDGTAATNERYLTKNNTWAEVATIPGTYTWSVEGDQGTPYTVNSGNTVDFAGSTYITTSTTSGPTLVITHDSTTTTPTTSSITPNFGSSFTAIDAISVNSTGHVTAINTKTINLGTPVWFADADTGSEDIENGTTVTFVGGTGMDTSINSNYEITFTNTDRGSSQNIFKNVAVSGQSTIVADSNNDTLTFVAGSNVSITTNATNDSITINSSDQYTGTVTSVAATAGSGISITGSPITTSGTLTITNTDRGSSQNIFKNFAVSGQSTVVADSNNDTLTLVAGSNVSLTTNATNDSITINATDTNTNNYVTSASFNTGNGVLTLNRSGLSAVTVDLDGRYLTSYTETDTLQSVTNRGASTTVRSIFTGGLNTNNSSTRDKISVYTGAPYVIGMQSGITYGHLNDWGMTFQFNNDSDRGFWWGDDSHSTAQGAMSLTTTGRLTVATSLSVGQGESVTSASTHPLFVDGTAVFDTTTNTEPVCITRSGSISSEVLKVGITDTQAQFIYIEDTSSEGTGNFGKYQFYLGGNAGESNIMPLEITKDDATFTVQGQFVESYGTPNIVLRSTDQYQYGRIAIQNNAGTTAASIEAENNPGLNQFAIKTQYIGSLRENFTIYSGNNAQFQNLSYVHFNNVPLRIGANSANNELDDYEEGTWTLSFGYANQGSVTSYAVSSFGGYSWTGRYVKIGRLVHCTFYFSCTSFPWTVNTSSQVYMLESSFPFALDSTTQAVNGTYYVFPGFNSSGTSSAEVTGALFPQTYASQSGAGFVADRGFPYLTFESPDTDAFNIGPGPLFYIRGSFQYYTAS